MITPKRAPCPRRRPGQGLLPGRVTGDVFRRDGDAFLRSWKHPALPPMTLLNPGEGLPAVWTADAAGTSRVFVWES